MLYRIASIETAEQATWVSPCGGHQRKALFNRGYQPLALLEEVPPLIYRSTGGRCLLGWRFPRGHRDRRPDSLHASFRVRCRGRIGRGSSLSHTRGHASPIPHHGIGNHIEEERR